MKMLNSGDVSAHFSSILKDVKAGNEITITAGKKNEAVAVIVPFKKWKPHRQNKMNAIKSLFGIIPNDEKTLAELRNERLSRYENIN